jgi:cytochrome c-type biogenesis protein
MLNVVKLPWLGREIRLKTPSFFTAGKPLNSFALGFSFGLGWTPCVGPVLGAILTLAAVQATAIQGGLLLGVFSLGLAIPFLLIAAIIESASNFIFKAGRFLRIVSVIGGLFLIFLGLLLLTNRFSLWIAFFYRLFDFINYDRLLEYL